MRNTVENALISVFSVTGGIPEKLVICTVFYVGC